MIILGKLRIIRMIFRMRKHQKVKVRSWDGVVLEFTLPSQSYLKDEIARLKENS